MHLDSIDDFIRCLVDLCVFSKTATAFFSFSKAKCSNLILSTVPSSMYFVAWNETFILGGAYFFATAG